MSAKGNPAKGSKKGSGSNGGRKQGDPVEEDVIPKEATFEHCARVHYVRVDQYSTDEERKKAFTNLGVNDFQNPFGEDASSFKKSDDLTEEERNMEGLGVRDLSTFARFRHAFDYARKKKLLKYPAVANAIYNFLAPAIYHLSPEELWEIRVDILHLVSMSGFVYSTGYVPANVAVPSMVSADDSDLIHSTGSRGSGKTSKWLPFTGKKKSNNNSILYTLGGRVFEGNGTTLPNVTAPDDAFQVSCQVTVPLHAAFMSRMNEAFATGELTHSVFVQSVKASECPGWFKNFAKESWNTIIREENGMQWAKVSPRIRNSGIVGGAKYITQEVPAAASAPKSPNPPNSRGPCTSK